jgi:hypothetical protein
LSSLQCLIPESSIEQNIKPCANADDMKISATENKYEQPIHGKKKEYHVYLNSCGANNEPAIIKPIIFKTA